MRTEQPPIDPVRRFCSLLVALLLTVGAVSRAMAASPPPDLEALRALVAERERAFARTMAERDHGGFIAMLSQETVFFGPQGAIRGKAAVAEAWKPFYDAATAPFSWEPEQVEVLASGTLAISSGPVRNSAGQRVTTFNSVWRLEDDGQWRVIFDKGCPGCPACAPASGSAEQP